MPVVEIQCPCRVPIQLFENKRGISRVDAVHRSCAVRHIYDTAAETKCTVPISDTHMSICDGKGVYLDN